jgi:hypothetical protein
MVRLIQLQNGATRGVALVEEPQLRLLEGAASVVALAREALATGTALTALARQRATGEWLDYEAIYRGESPWRILPAIDHPEEPARCLVSGTGLTHLGSAKDRQAMHSLPEADMTDSMKMFLWGVKSGKPAPGEIGIAPEWFYKGTGTILRAHGEPLVTPSFDEGGGEEAEVAGVYFIADDGRPRRIGMAAGNEFSDHEFEKKNYLNLAGSKIRQCALGPELVIDLPFVSLAGRVAIERGGREFWSRSIRTGEAEMCHHLRNLEHHHFKFDTHRRPGDVHVHYFGANGLSFGDGVRLADGDVMAIQFDGFGRALRNRLRVTPPGGAPVTVEPLG